MITKKHPLPTETPQAFPSYDEERRLADLISDPPELGRVQLQYHSVRWEAIAREARRVYSLPVELAQTKQTADRDEFGDPDRSAAPHTAPVGDDVSGV
jgi:hypothetical protein